MNSKIDFKEPSYGARYLLTQCAPIFKENNWKHAWRDKTVSTKTQHERRSRIKNFFILLHDVLGFKIKSINNVSQKHIKAAAKHLEQMDYSPGHIQNILSDLRTFFHCWLNKKGVVPDKSELFTSPKVYKRSIVSQTDKSWTGVGANITEAIDKVFIYSEIIGLQLLSCYIFGLRVQEALCFRPIEGDYGDKIFVGWGAKNGRTRTVDIKSGQQLVLLQLLQAYAIDKSGSLIPADRNLASWRNHFNYVINRYGGISKKELKATPHGLRHEFAIQEYEALTGMDAPIRKIMQATVNNKSVDREARKKISELLGHTRISITAAYVGGLLGRLPRK